MRVRRTRWATLAAVSALTFGLAASSAGISAAEGDSPAAASASAPTPAIEATIQAMVASGALQNPDLLRPLLGVQSSYLDAGFDEVAKRYGSFDVYLRDGLGVDAVTLARLRLRLLTI